MGDDQPRTAGGTTGGDAITAGNISNSIAAIGAGAQVIVKNALSAADEARDQQSLEREKLAQAIARLAGQLAEQLASPPPTTGSPYKNLLPYEVADAGRFAGRDTEIDQLREQVVCADSRCRFAVLHGESGSGKTSLLQAGLMPLLVADQNLPVYVRITGTGKSLTEQIKRTLLAELDLTPQLQQMSLRGFLQQVVDLLPSGKRLYLILDQFDAYFDLPVEARQSFVDDVSACLSDESQRDHWVLSLRSSMLGHLNVFQAATQPFANTTVLPLLGPAAAREVIVRPAEARGLTVEKPLVDALLNDLGATSIDPSRLQLVCDAVYQAKPAGGSALSLANYEAAGRAEGILNQYLDRTLARNLPTEDRDVAWRVLAVIARCPSNTITESRLYDDLDDYGIQRGEAARVMNLLSTNRLVRQVETPGYHLTSDQFVPRIREWDTQQAALEQARAEAKRQVERVRGSALRGLLGGGIGFTLAYLLTFGSQIQNKTLLGYIAAYRALPGAIGGMLLILFVDLALASYRGPRRWMRWLVGGLAGAGAFGLAVLFHGVMRSLPPTELLLAAAEGALWGVVSGVGAIWIMSHPRTLAVKLGLAAAVSVVSGPVLLGLDALAGSISQRIGEASGGAFGTPASVLLTVLAGIVMPLFVLAAAIWAEVGDTDYS